MLEKLFSLKNKVVILTGASQGIGKELAVVYAKLGAKLALIARNQSKLEKVKQELQNLNCETIIISCDLTNTKEIAPAFASVYKHFGRIDVLVNNAGTNITKSADRVTESDWDTVLDINLKSTFFCSQAVYSYMKESRVGKIINMSSQMAEVGYYKRSAYCSSKGGVKQLTKSLAVEWAADNILINSIAPTFIETPMTEKMFEDEAFKEDVFNRIPLGRLAKPEDLFGALVYLSSDASNMVTGQTLFVDGGWTIW